MEINAANSKPYIYQQLRALELEKVEQILRNFDVNSNKHVDRIYNPKGGQAYIFYTKDKSKINDYKVDGYNWRCSAGAKATPASNPILFR